MVIAAATRGACTADFHPAHCTLVNTHSSLRHRTSSFQKVRLRHVTCQLDAQGALHDQPARMTKLPVDPCQGICYLLDNCSHQLLSSDAGQRSRGMATLTPTPNPRGSAGGEGAVEGLAAVGGGRVAMVEGEGGGDRRPRTNRRRHRMDRRDVQRGTLLRLDSNDAWNVLGSQETVPVESWRCRPPKVSSSSR